MSLPSQFKSARRAGVPLIAITTPDPAATVATIANCDLSPILTWDVANGFKAVNEAGKLVLGNIDVEQGLDPISMLEQASRLPDDSILFVLNGGKIIEAIGLPWVQRVWNLRDSFKRNRRTLVLIGVSIKLPPELELDFVCFDEPLPGPDQLYEIAKQIDEAAVASCPDRPRSDEATLQRVVDAISGLSAFQAEQVVAMAVRKDGFDFTTLWELKRQLIEQTPGLSIWRGNERFSDICGLDNVKSYLLRKLNGKRRYGAIVFLDEIEKLLAGATEGTADSSGVSQGFLQALLVYMQDNAVSGLIFLGHPGAGKSMVAKAAGNEAGIPTIAFDLNAMKASLVGESELRIRSALKVVTAVSTGRPLFIATCNKIAVLPPELRRRFTAGTFFFDLPDANERDAIWRHYMAKYELPEQKRPNDNGWTGAEIKSCCEIAWELDVSLEEASRYIVPVSKADPDGIERLRKEAVGRYISASYPGPYQLPTESGFSRKVLA